MNRYEEHIAMSIGLLESVQRNLLNTGLSITIELVDKTIEILRSVQSGDDNEEF